MSIHLEPTAWLGELCGAPIRTPQFRYLGGGGLVTLSHRIQSVGFDPVSQNEKVITDTNLAKASPQNQQHRNELARSRGAVVCISKNTLSVTNDFADLCLIWGRKTRKYSVWCRTQVSLTFRQRLLKPSTCLLPASFGSRKYGYYHGR